MFVILFFCFENFTFLRLDQWLGMTSKFVFTNNNTIFNWITIQKQVAKNVIEQQLHQITLDLGIEYPNFNSEITLLPSLDIIDHKI